MEKIKKQYNGKSIWDTSPDLIEQNNTLVSKIDDTGYRLINYRSYTGKNGQYIDFLTLSAFTMHGTFGERNSYIITSKNNIIWNVLKIDENSPL